MNAIWGAHLMSLTKLIVVVDDDCDVHDYARGRLAGVRQRRLRPRPAAHRGPGRPPRPRLLPAVLGRQGGHRRDPQAARPRATPRRLAGRDGHVDPEVVGAGRQALEGVRPLMARRRRARRSRAGSRRSCGWSMIEHSVFALPFAYLAALTAMPVDGGRCTGCDLLLVTVAMVGPRTFAMAANRIIDRRDRRAQPAYRRPGTGHRRGERADRLDRRGRSRWSSSSAAAAAAQPALPGARPARRGAAGGLPVRQAVHQLPARHPRRSPRRSARSAPGSRSPARSPAPGRPGCSASAVGLWIGGFDLIYACQDAEVDRRDRRAQSCPARFGVAVRAARRRPSRTW